MVRTLVRNAVQVGLFILVLATSASAQEWTWTTSQIDIQGTDSWLAVDQYGNVHVSYRIAEGGKLRYAYLPAGGSHWFNMTLDSMLGDFLTGISLDPKGNPYVCYTPGVLKLASFDGKRWRIQQVDPGSGLVGFYCSVRFGKDGNPQLSWYVDGMFKLRYAVLENGIWIAQNVDTQDMPGKINSMAVDANGNPQLSYIGLYGTRLKYAKFNGSNWIRTTLEAPAQGISRSHGDTGMGNSIVVDREGNPMISYFDTSSLKYAHLVDGKWQFQVIDTFDRLDKWAWRSFRSIIVLDEQGRPHIGYQSPLGLKHAWWDGQKWNTQVILAPAGSTFDGGMAMDHKDNLYFSYTDPVQHTLMLAIGRYAENQRAESSPSIETKSQP